MISFMYMQMVNMYAWSNVCVYVCLHACMGHGMLNLFLEHFNSTTSK